jgi:hypothetical protein
MTSNLRKKYFDNVVANPNFLKKSELKLNLLCKENNGTGIYKYCNVETALKCLSTSSLLLQHPENFNDPFDCMAKVEMWRPNAKFAPSADEIECVRQELSKLPTKFQPTDYFILNDLRLSSTVAVTCFSSSNKNHAM